MFFKQHLTILFIITALFNFLIAQDLCRHPKTIKKFDEVPCTEIVWYIYAGSRQCDGCCLTRRMVLLEPGVIQATDTTTVNGVTTSITFVAQRNNTDSTYYLAGNPLPITIIDTDCATYGVVYSGPSNQVQVFTYEAVQEPDFLRKIKGVKRCDAALYEYNPAVNCLGTG